MQTAHTTEGAERDTRAAILDAAARLIASGGIAALTTRSVATAAAVQPPALYRLFGDKRGLLDAVAEHGMAGFVAEKVAATPHQDPVQDLRDAWDAYVSFSLVNPAVFAISNEVGSGASPSPAALAGIAVLRSRVGRIASAGRLRMAEDRAVALIHAAGVGTASTLLAGPAADRDLRLVADAREAVIAAVVTDDPTRSDRGLAPFAVGLNAHLDAAQTLTPGERLLMRELLGRLLDGEG